MEVGKNYKIVYQSDNRAKVIFAKIVRLIPENTPRFVEIQALADGTVFIVNVSRIIEMKELGGGR